MSEKRFHFEDLVNFSKEIFVKLGMSEKDALISADVLIRADLRGIPSHGIQRLRRYYNGMKDGIIIPDARPEVVKNGGAYTWVNAHHSMGQVAATEAMEYTIEKASSVGMAMATVFDSNHYGYAAHYALMALDKNLIGISMTNSAPLVVPTYGKEAILGTNPISISAPSGKNRPFVMDFATSIVARGKIEMYKRWGEDLPENWAVEEHGEICTDPQHILDNLKDRLGGGILPLGGAGEKFGGHKGYGFSFMVDIFCGILSGAHFGKQVASKNMAKNGEPPFHNVGHFFAALNPEVFIGLEAFKTRMDEYIDTVKDSEKAAGQERIYIHGEKEFEKMDEYLNAGIPLIDNVIEDIKEVGASVGVALPDSL